MPFLQREPFRHAEVTYVWAGVHQPGFFRVTVQGEAPKISFGFQLRRDTNFAGGLAVEVLGWTGPLVAPPSTAPYSVTNRFDGAFLKEIVVIGSNKSEMIPVTEISFTSDEDFMKLLDAH